MVYLSHYVEITRVGVPYSVQGTRDTWVDREQSLCPSFDVPVCLDTGASACTSCAPVSLFSTTGRVFPSHPDADHLPLLMISISTNILQLRANGYALASILMVLPIKLRLMLVEGNTLLTWLKIKTLKFETIRRLVHLRDIASDWEHVLA